MEKDLLEGYENKTDMKRYDPELYEQNFGEDSEYYELTKEKEKRKRKLGKKSRKRKTLNTDTEERGKDLAQEVKALAKDLELKSLVRIKQILRIS